MAPHVPRLDGHRRACRRAVAPVAAVLHLLTPAVLALIVAAAPALAQDPLSPAKDHYVAAEYEKALGALDEARKAAGIAPATLLAVEQYRALCLLALGRKVEAERAIEAVLDLDPFYVPGEDEAAPWVQAAFRDVRRRVLPATLQQRYGRGKQAFERKEYAAADQAFADVLRILSDPDLALDEAAKSDMRLVVQGFLDLSKATRAVPPSSPLPEVASVPSAPRPEAASPSAASKAASGSEQVPAQASESGSPVYDSTAQDVLPPVPLRQSVVIPEQARPREEVTGVVEIVIDTRGFIESVIVRQSFGPALDRLVLQSVKDWRYRAGERAGNPVRYRRLVRIVLPSR